MLINQVTVEAQKYDLVTAKTRTVVKLTLEAEEGFLSAEEQKSFKAKLTRLVMEIKGGSLEDYE